MKNRIRSAVKSSSLVQHVLAIPLKRYERYGIEADPIDSCCTDHADSAACSAARQALIKRVKRRIVSSGKPHVIVTFNSVRGRSITYLLKRGEATANVSHLIATKEPGDDARKVTTVNEPGEAVKMGPDLFSKREIRVMSLGKRSEVMQTLRALRRLDVSRYEYNFQIPIGNWAEIPHFDKLKLVKIVDCDCEPQNEMSFNPECPLCSLRALDDLIDALDEFCAAPEFFYDKSEAEIAAADGKYDLSDLMAYEYNMTEFGAAWDCVNGSYHASMYDIVYRVESCLRGGVAVSLDNLREYADRLRECRPCAKREIECFKVEDAREYDNSNRHDWID